MVRSVARPAVDPALAAHLARDLYGFAGEVVELPSERDRNFLLRREQTDVVLKIAHADTSREVLLLQDACLQHLATLDGVAVPVPLRTNAGEALADVEIDGAVHHVRMVSFLPGRPLGALRPKDLATLRRVGAAAARLVVGLGDFDPPGVPDDFAWDLRTAAGTIEHHRRAIADPGRRRMIETLTARAEAALEGLWPGLPVGVVHGDLNDHNVIVGEGIGVIDFGDLHRSVRIAEIAVAASYAAFGFVDPVEAIAAVASGAHAVRPLPDAEVAAIVPLAVLRLGLSVVAAAQQAPHDPGNAYLTISEDDAWTTLERLASTPWYLALARIRSACGLVPCPRKPAVEAWIAAHPDRLRPVLGVAMDAGSTTLLDWSVTSPLAQHPEVAPPVTVQAKQTENLLEAAEAAVGIGRFGEPRLVYAAPEFAVQGNHGPAWRTVHLGVDLSCPPGTTVHAVLDGTVERVDDDAVAGGYGPVVTLRHEPEPGVGFFSLYGHLAASSVIDLAVGMAVGAGDVIGAVGQPHENGGWPPHLHFQAMTDLLDLEGPLPGVAAPHDWDAWSGLCPSPAGLLGLPEDRVIAPSPDEGHTLERRRHLLPPSLSTSYARPLVAVRGHGVWLYDGWGRAHLDCVNNVAHVGHEHPHVVAALRRQAALLNTNSRYPHPERIRYVERLVALFPDGLDTVFLVNSGSEANDLALRIARTVTGRRDVIVVAGAYHGHTALLIDASPYKHAGPGGSGPPPEIHVVPVPDPYRSVHGADAEGHLGEVAAVLALAPPPAALLVEPIMGVAGQIDPPPGYLAGASHLVRSVGGLVIADEVQVGLGRIGSHWWAFERAGVVPDIVTLGKPLGNGHPLAAVVTTRAIAGAFANGMEYFNTFGGNPVSCAVGNAVLDVIEVEGIRRRAGEMGERLGRVLRALGDRHPIIGDVRGAGMFLGVDLVADRVAKTPATAQAAYLVERARDLGVLLATDGPGDNVLKIKPPLVFDGNHAERLLDTLDTILGEDGAQPDTDLSRPAVIRTAPGPS